MSKPSGKITSDAEKKSKEAKIESSKRAKSTKSSLPKEVKSKPVSLKTVKKAEKECEDPEKGKEKKEKETKVVSMKTVKPAHVMLFGDCMPPKRNRLFELEKLKEKWGNVETLEVEAVGTEVSKMLIKFAVPKLEKLSHKLMKRHAHFNATKSKKVDKIQLIEWTQTMAGSIEKRIDESRVDPSPALLCWQLAEGLLGVLKKFNLEERFVGIKLKSLSKKKGSQSTIDVQIVGSQVFLFIMSILDPDYN